MNKEGRNKYCVQAKRKNTKEKWSEWTRVDNYEDAVRHSKNVENLGYRSKIVERREE